MMTTLSSADVLPTLSEAVARLASTAAPSIVQVHGRPHRPASGFVVAPERVVTTSHSVEWDEGIRIRTLDGEVRGAEIAGHDATTDVVLLRVPGLDAPALPYAAVTPRMGSLALVAGRSWRGTPHVRLTAISSVSGPVQSSDGGRLDEVLGLGIDVYGGFSGSALLDPRGAVAGIATAGILRGSALAIPASALQPVVEGLEQHGSRARGYLGISTHPVRLPDQQKAAAAADEALLIVEVGADTPAARAGLLVGDVLVSFDGARIESAEGLLAALGPDRVGTDVALTVLRGAAPVEARVKIEPRVRRRARG